MELKAQAQAQGKTNTAFLETFVGSDTTKMVELAFEFAALEQALHFWREELREQSERLFTMAASLGNQNAQSYLED